MMKLNHTRLRAGLACADVVHSHRRWDSTTHTFEEAFQRGSAAAAHALKYTSQYQTILPTNVHLHYTCRIWAWVPPNRAKVQTKTLTPCTLLPTRAFKLAQSSSCAATCRNQDTGVDLPRERTTAVWRRLPRLTSRLCCEPGRWWM